MVAVDYNYIHVLTYKHQYIIPLCQMVWHISSNSFATYMLEQCKCNYVPKYVRKISVWGMPQ